MSGHEGERQGVAPLGHPLQPEQLQRESGLLVCLREDGGAGLLVNTGADEEGGVGGDIGVLDAGLGSREVFSADLKI